MRAFFLIISTAILPLFAADVLPKPVPLLSHVLPDFPKLGNLPAELPFKKAVKAQITEVADPPWKVRILQRLAPAVKKDDMLVVEFWAKSITPECKLSLRLEERRTPWRASIETKTLTPDAEWQHMVFAGKAVDNFPANELQLSIPLAYAKQTIAFSDICVNNYGPIAVKPEEVVKQIESATSLKK